MINMTKKILKSLVLILFAFAILVIIFLTYSHYKALKKSPEMENLEFNYLVSRCNFIDGSCPITPDLADINSDYSMITYSSEPIEWNISYPLKSNCTKIVKLSGYSHVHSVNEVSGGEIVYTARSNDGKNYIIKRNVNSSFERFEINELPFCVYAFEDTVLFIMPNNNNSAIIAKVDFCNKKLLTIIDDLDFDFTRERWLDYSKIPGRIWINGSKIFYKSVADNWKIYNNNDVKNLNLDFDGICVGFNSDDSVVFYKDTVKVLFPFSSEVFYSWGKFTEYDCDDGSTKVLSRIISENYPLRYFNITSDGKYVIMKATNEEGTSITSLVNIEKGEVLKLGRNIWSPDCLSSLQQLH